MDSSLGHSLIGRVCGVIVLVGVALGCGAPATDYVALSVAASMGDVTDSLVAAYRLDNPDSRFEVNVGASSTLARQIEYGATADIFLSADTVWSTYVVDRSTTAISRRLPASNSIVVVSKKRAANVEDLLANARRIALGDPSHVPAGRYAVSTLECLGWWHSVSDRVVPTADVRAALAVAVSNSVDAAVVYRTDSIQLDPTFVIPLPQECQPAIGLDMVITGMRPENPHVESFADFVDGSAAAEIWRVFGFSLPTRED